MFPDQPQSTSRQTRPPEHHPRDRRGWCQKNEILLMKPRPGVVGWESQVLWKHLEYILSYHFNNTTEYYPQVEVFLAKFTQIRNGSNSVLEINVLSFGGLCVSVCWSVCLSAEKWKILCTQVCCLRDSCNIQEIQPRTLSSALRGSTWDLIISRSSQRRSRSTNRRFNRKATLTWIALVLI